MEPLFLQQPMWPANNPPEHPPQLGGGGGCGSQTHRQIRTGSPLSSPPLHEYPEPLIEPLLVASLPPPPRHRDGPSDSHPHANHEDAPPNSQREPGALIPAARGGLEPPEIPEGGGGGDSPRDAVPKLPLGMLGKEPQGSTQGRPQGRPKGQQRANV